MLKVERHSKIVELIGKYEIETQEELAEQVGLTPAYIGPLDAPNISKALSLDTLFDIASVLDVAPQKFLAFED